MGLGQTTQDNLRRHLFIVEGDILIKDQSAPVQFPGRNLIFSRQVLDLRFPDVYGSPDHQPEADDEGYESWCFHVPIYRLSASESGYV